MTTLADSSKEPYFKEQLQAIFSQLGKPTTSRQYTSPHALCAHCQQSSASLNLCLSILNTLHHSIVSTCLTRFVGPGGSSAMEWPQLDQLPSYQRMLSDFHHQKYHYYTKNPVALPHILTFAHTYLLSACIGRSESHGVVNVASSHTLIGQL